MDLLSTLAISTLRNAELIQGSLILWTMAGVKQNWTHTGHSRKVSPVLAGQAMLSIAAQSLRIHAAPQHLENSSSCLPLFF